MTAEHATTEPAKEPANARETPIAPRVLVFYDYA